MRSFLCLLFSIFSIHVFSAAQIIQLNVSDNNVRFAIDEEKTHTLPSCAHASKRNEYSFSLNNEQGRAMYSMLITALAGELPISVESANDCLAIVDVERAKGVSVAVKPALSDGYKGVSMLYKGDGITKIGRIEGFASDDRYLYIAPLSEGQDFSMYYRRDVYTDLVYFLEENCLGAGYVSTKHKYASFPFYQDRAMFTPNKESLKRRQVKSHATRAGCTNISFLKDVYELTPAVHPVCGSKHCIIRDE
ncbi:hypothetical protein J8M21_22910 [Pseudoalteromonas luteoviolacea]|uniref:hypothetical protein n=1 Tax=Pseudoalteromonas luteoviolacea TaxID=43657 RepID=UPI001B3A52E7|nr:hypothetical protein [Pseudoalteromonas luteoviolacea]MBQ4880066.1 hypothetical protein [Pseudoalteromonas luteoviolacea]MBQ4909083.1 hypothetical protein [Pseudoalteromonas luteoviolacea]